MISEDARGERAPRRERLFIGLWWGDRRRGGGGGGSETRVIPVKAEAAEAPPDGSREEGEGPRLALMTVLRCTTEAQGAERNSGGNGEKASRKREEKRRRELEKC